MLGKVDPETLRRLVLGRTGAPREDVLQGPAYGEDAAAVDVDGTTLVVNTDPISMAADRVGSLGVTVACNDVAASGGRPAWLTDVVFLPGGADDPAAVLDRVTAQVDETASDLGVSVVGGHSEYVSALATPLLVFTCLGPAERYVPTGGARPGDRLLVTKAAGIEATAILATDFRASLADAVDAAVLDRAATFYRDVSVLPDGAALAPHADAMHDPTEGGLVDGLFEMAAAAGVELDVDPAAVPVRPETATLCDAAGVDPFRVFGSGMLVAAVPPADVEAATAALADRDVPVADVGVVREAATPRLVLGAETFEAPVRDEMYALWE
ncbi:MAG: AIR synthase family protein [Halobacteriaceae archaeon]